jgi:hypothetical protein
MSLAQCLGLRQRHARLVREGGDQMHAGDFLPVDAAQRLAVNRQRLIWLQPLLREPLAQHLLKGGVVEATKGAMQRRHTRPPLPP